MDIKICVDLDNTLIDSVQRYTDEQIVAVKYGLDPSTYVKCVEKLFERHGNYYSYKLLLPILQEVKTDIKEGILPELESLLDRKYLFEDTEFFLSRFQKEQLVLVTSGDQVVQSRKIAAHQLESLFCAMILNPSNKADVVEAQKAGMVYFVDDAPREIEKVKKQCGLATCIQVREPPPWEKQKTTDYADYRVANLFEAVKIITGAI